MLRFPICKVQICSYRRFGTGYDGFHFLRQPSARTACTTEAFPARPRQSAGIAVSFLSKVEAGNASPTLATLMKLAGALGMTLIELLSPPSPPPDNLTIIPPEQMKVVDDGERCWQYLLPNHPRIRAIFTDEVYRPRTAYRIGAIPS